MVWFASIFLVCQRCNVDLSSLLWIYNVTMSCPKCTTRMAVAVELALSVFEQSEHSIPLLYGKIKHRPQWCKI